MPKHKTLLNKLVCMYTMKYIVALKTRTSVNQYEEVSEVMLLN